MDIIVLIKQVPATETMISIADDKKSINMDNVKMVMNPYDELAVEEALQIKKTHGGSVSILSLGTDKTVEAIRTGLAMGADTGILINDPAAKDCDGIGTAKILAAAIKNMPHDLIIAGQRAVDDDNYIVGPGVAEFLNIPHISFVIEQEITDKVIKCTQTVDSGTAIIKAPLPVLLTTQRGLNEPRYASLPGIMKAKKKKIETKTLADIGLDPADIVPKTKILEIKLPPERKPGRMITGDSAQTKAAELVKALREEAKVI